MIKNKVLNILELGIEKLQRPIYYQNSAIISAKVYYIENSINFYYLYYSLSKVCVYWLKWALVTYHNYSIICCAEDQKIKLKVKVHGNNLMALRLIVIFIVSFLALNIPVIKLTIFKACWNDLILATKKHKVNLKRMSYNVNKLSKINSAVYIENIWGVCSKKISSYWEACFWTLFIKALKNKLNLLLIYLVYLEPIIGSYCQQHT